MEDKIIECKIQIVQEANGTIDMKADVHKSMITEKGLDPASVVAMTMFMAYLRTAEEFMKGHDPNCECEASVMHSNAIRQLRILNKAQKIQVV